MLPSSKRREIEEGQRVSHNAGSAPDCAQGADVQVQGPQASFWGSSIYNPRLPFLNQERIN